MLRAGYGGAPRRARHALGRLAVAAIVLAVSLALAESAGAVAFKGRTAQGKQATVEVGAEGKVRKAW